MTSTSDFPDIQQRVGDRYPIERELGRGGMGAVYLARDPGISRSITATVDNGATRGLTRVGEVVGTAEYMSPEQASGDVNLSLDVRFSLGTKAEVVQTESREPAQPALGRLFMTVSGLGLLGASFLLIARSPFRMPPAERMFRVVWLGPPGRWFVRVSSRKITPPSSGKTASGLANVRANANMAETGRAAAPVVVATTTISTDRMRSLEDRIAALERWRDGAKT